MPKWPVGGDELRPGAGATPPEVHEQKHICDVCRERATEVVGERLYHKQGRPTLPPTLEAPLGLTLDTTTTKHD